MYEDKRRIIPTHHGSSVLKTVGNFSSNNSDDETDEHEIVRVYVPRRNSLLKPDALKAMPPEDYRNNLTPMERRKFFFKNLKIRDIIYLQVIDCNDGATFSCLVIAKHGTLMRLEDLSIIYNFPKSHPELSKSRALVKFDLIRGALWMVSGCSKMMFTFNTGIYNAEEMETVPTLGLISQKDLPYYVGLKKVGQSYSGYIQHSKGYRAEEGYCQKQLSECLGMDTNRIYSFFEEWNGKSYPASECLDEIKNKPIPDPSTENILKSVEFFNMGNMYKAFHHSNKAIALNPDNVQARVTRGKVYASLGKLKDAFVDTIDSLKLDGSNEAASKQMANLLVDDSRTHLRKRNFIKWHEWLVLAANYNPQNREVQELLNYATFETSPDGVPTPIQPSLGNVLTIYSRVFNEDDKRKRVKQFQKLRKMHKQRRRLAARQEAE